MRVKVLVWCQAILIWIVCLLGYYNVKEAQDMRDRMIEQVNQKTKIIADKDLLIQQQGFRIIEQEEKIKELTESVEQNEIKGQELSVATRVITCEVTAYSIGDGYTPSDTMANGEHVYVGACACNFLPFGTQVRINGNIYTVADRSGVDGIIDIYMDSVEECNAWGRRTMEVEIL